MDEGRDEVLPKDDGLVGKTGKAVAWTVVEKWSIRLVSLAIFAILARLLSPSDFGLASIATVVISILNVFVDSGFSSAIVQRSRVDDRLTATCFWTSITYSFVLYVALFALAPAIANAYGMTELVWVLRVLGLSLLLGALSSVPAALLERALDFRALALRQMAGTLAGAVAGLAVALLHGGVWALVVQAVLTPGVSTVVLWFKSEWRPTRSFSLSELKELLPFSLGILGNDLLLTVQSNIDKLLIGLFFGVHDVGLYFVAQRSVNIVVELATTVFSRVSLSAFSRIGADPARRQRAYMRMTLMSGMVALPSFGALAVLADYYVPVLIGSGWIGVSPVFRVLAVSAAIISVTYFDTPLLVSVGHPIRALSLGVIQNCVAAGLIVIAAPHGLVAVAAATVAMRLITWPVRLFAISRDAGVSSLAFLLQVARLFACTGVPLVAVWMLARTSWGAASPGLWVFAIPVTVLFFLTSFALMWISTNRETRRTLSKGLHSTLNRV